jgi:hypothetical protein
MVFYLEKVNKEKNLWCYSIYIITCLLIFYFIYNSFTFNKSYKSNKKQKDNDIIYENKIKKNNKIINENKTQKDNKIINENKVLNNLNLYNQEVYNKFTKF